MLTRENLDELVYPHSADNYSRALRTPGTYLHKQFLNLRIENVAFEDILCILIERNEMRTNQERKADETRLRELLEREETKASKNGQFAVPVEYPEEHKGKSEHELKAALAEVTKELLLLEAAKNKYISTIAAETAVLQNIQIKWDARQSKEAKDYLRQIGQSDDKAVAKMATPEMEKAFKVVSPATLLKVNPELINAGTPPIVNAIDDIMRQLRILSLANRIERELQNTVYEDNINPSDIIRLMKCMPAVPRHTKADETATADAFHAFKKRRHAEVGLKIKDEEILVKQKEQNHLNDLIATVLRPAPRT